MKLDHLNIDLNGDGVAERYEIGASNANDISYDKTASQISANNVQTAIDQMNTSIKDNKVSYDVEGTNLTISGGFGTSFSETLILDTGYMTLTGAGEYPCISGYQWSDFKMLNVAFGNYGNVYSTVLIPTSYFKTTVPGNRLILRYSTYEIQVYQNTANQSSVMVYVPDGLGGSYLRVRIWGIN